MNWHLPLELVARSAVLLAAAEGLRRVYRSRSAASRHRLLVWTFAWLTLLPLLLIVLPEIRVPVWPARPEHAQVTVLQSSLTLGEADHSAHRVNWPVWIWLTGSVFAFLPVLAGAAVTWKMVRNSQRLLDADWLALLAEITAERGIARPPELLVCERLPLPVTCGLRHTRILLPGSAYDWTPVRRRAVLLHELAHIERRDLAAQFYVHAVAALWWFQPLVWMLRRSVRAESELACDAMALAAGVRPSQYAAELLDIAKGLPRNTALANFAGISMARRGDLETRVRHILGASAGLWPQKWNWAALLVLSAVAVCSSTVTAKAKQSLHQSGDFIMKRSLLSGLLASAGLSAATLTGTIFDPSGAAIADARLSLINPDTGQKLETSSGPDGKFAVGDAPAGEYILRVEKPGFSPLLREFNLKADSNIERGLIMNLGPVEQQVRVEGKGRPADSLAASPPDRIRVGGKVEQANLIRKVQPVYPAEAKTAGLQGTVELEAVISKEGVPLEIRVVRSPGDQLSQSALEAVRQWRYRPTLLNGNPVEIVTDVIVNYTLSE